MATSWEIFLDAGLEARIADGAARAAFDLLERLDRLLSRFVGGSDISRINTSHGEPVVVEPETAEVLRLAARFSRETDGAFDAAWATPTAARTAMGGATLFAVDSEAPIVRKTHPETRLDLGAVGKGFALDQMAALMARDWDVRAGLLHGGGSSVLAMEAPSWDAGWPVTIGTTEGRDLLRLVRAALGASGYDVRGSHIVDPRTGERVRRYRATWALAPSAAEADALSTAFAVMSPAGIRAWMSRRPAGYAARWIIDTPDGPRLEDAGRWPTLQPVLPASGIDDAK